MKKILNDPFAYADETLQGLVRAYPQYYRLVEGTTRVIARAETPKNGKVGIVSGGGSGHLPIFTGYVGPGFLDAVASGDVFASPSADEMATAIRAADTGAGVLRLYGNYGGDVMNFDMAGDLAEMDGITCATVLLADDVASASLAEREKRRGVAGMVLAFKIAGAAAEAGLDLAGVTEVAQRAADGCRTMGVALSSCTVPQAGKPTFSLGEDEMEVGMGIHGEPGVMRGKLQTANQIADAMLDPILADLNLPRGAQVAVLVNSLGATPVEELFILYNRIADRLEAEGITPTRRIVGRYATSMEMAGVSLTLLPLDDTLDGFLAAPAECAFWKV
ncbi:dihydroxyacetone kinase subunit DhaK [Roseicitreum antarcticum]|uniref:Dihydroxyacetone kinase DhaK subunit n=1 Tax=Roseicitreum antarcticum TaxID=564137 RepID=A0A1H2YIS9_9RHOB|nr:dihydroxyacetone kinase subunit DhaK [Roseicitreum antarcticum]SDX05132.1 dihydroxyacetone kinase DhaK subunit [Roseicitreum antarcticum]